MKEEMKKPENAVEYTKLKQWETIVSVVRKTGKQKFWCKKN